MTSPTTDRRLGLTGGSAFKVPCKAATTTSITLSGTQTVDGVSCTTGDRVLVKDQASSVDNGVYVVDTGTWTRDLDFDGANDVVTGTLVTINSGSSNGEKAFRLTTTGTITFGSTSLDFEQALFSSLDGATFLQAGTGAVSRPAQDKMRESVSVFDFMTSAQITDVQSRAGLVDVTAAINAAITAVGTAGGGAVFMPAGTYTVTSQTDAILIKFDDVTLYGAGRSATIIKNATTSKASVIHAYKGTYPGGLSIIKRVAISDLCVDGNQANITHPANDTYGNGIVIDFGQDCRVTDNEAKNCVFQGIILQGSGDATSKGNIVEENIVSACGEFGIGLEGGIYDSTIAHNYVHDLITVAEVTGGGVGIVVSQISQTGTGNKVIGNTVNTVPAHGILVQDGSANTLIMGNVIKTCGSGVNGGAGIDVSGSVTSSNHVSVIGNVLTGASNKNSGSIQVRSSSGAVGYCEVTGNKIADGSGCGILISSGTHITVSGNVIRNVGSGAGSVTSGIRLAGNTVSPVVTGNVVDTTAGNGIEVVSGTTGAIIKSDNAVSNAIGSAISDSGTSSVIEGVAVTYTPTWTSSGTAPALGNGSLTGKYIRVGNIVHLDIHLLMGSTSTFGTGVYFFSLPIAPSASFIEYNGSAHMLDTGVADYVGIAKADSTNGIRILTSTSPSGTVGQLVPHTWGNADTLHVQITYEV